MDTRVTGGNPKSFAKNAKKIVIDIDKKELEKKRGLHIDLKIKTDLKNFFNNYKKFVRQIVVKKNWLTKCTEWKDQYPIIQKKFFNTHIYYSEQK